MRKPGYIRIVLFQSNVSETLLALRPRFSKDTYNNIDRDRFGIIIRMLNRDYNKNKKHNPRKALFRGNKICIDKTQIAENIINVIVMHAKFSNVSARVNSSICKTREIS